MWRLDLTATAASEKLPSSAMAHRRLASTPCPNGCAFVGTRTTAFPRGGGEKCCSLTHAGCARFRVPRVRTA